MITSGSFIFYRNENMSKSRFSEGI